MSGRDDSSLYTGATSASFNPPISQEVKKSRTDQRTESSRTRSELLPAADIINEMIENELTEVSTIDYLDIEKMLDDEHFKSELMARKKYVEKLKDFRTRITNKLRDNKDQS